MAVMGREREPDGDLVGNVGEAENVAGTVTEGELSDDGDKLGVVVCVCDGDRECSSVPDIERVASKRGVAVTAPVSDFEPLFD